MVPPEAISPLLDFSRIEAGQMATLCRGNYRFFENGIETRTASFNGKHGQFDFRSPDIEFPSRNYSYRGAS